MSSFNAFDSFQKTGIPPQYGKTQKEYENFLGVVKDNEDKVDVVFDERKKDGYNLLPNRAFPSWFPTLTHISCSNHFSCEPEKVELEDNYRIFLPKLVSPSQKEESVNHSILRAIRKNIFNKESYGEDVSGYVPKSIFTHPKKMGLFSECLLAGLALIPYTFCFKIASLPRSISLPVTILAFSCSYYALRRHNKKVNRIYDSVKKLSETTSGKFVQFFPVEEIFYLADKDLPEIQKYTQQKFNETNYATYNIALNLIK